MQRKRVNKCIVILADEMLNNGTLKERQCGHQSIQIQHIEFWNEVKKLAL